MSEQVKKKAPKSFCEPDCAFCIEIECPDFNKPSGMGSMLLCSYGDGKRSFGCMNCCPKKFGEA